MYLPENIVNNKWIMFQIKISFGFSPFKSILGSYPGAQMPNLITFKKNIFWFHEKIGKFFKTIFWFHEKIGNFFLNIISISRKNWQFFSNNSIFWFHEKISNFFKILFTSQMNCWSIWTNAKDIVYQFGNYSKGFIVERLWKNKIKILINQ